MIESDHLTAGNTLSHSVFELSKSGTEETIAKLRRVTRAMCLDDLERRIGWCDVLEKSFDMNRNAWVRVVYPARLAHFVHFSHVNGSPKDANGMFKRSFQSFTSRSIWTDGDRSIRETVVREHADKHDGLRQLMKARSTLLLIMRNVSAMQRDRTTPVTCKQSVTP